MKTLRTAALSALITLIALAGFTALTPGASAQNATEPLVRNLISLGLAHPVSGKLLAGAIVDSTAVVGGTTQSTDNTLNSVSLDDEMLAKVGRGMVITGWGSTAANGNTKDIKLKIGGTAICTITDSTANAKDFAIVAFVVEDAADSQKGFCWVTVDGALVAASSINFTATIDANATMAIITTGDNNSAAASAATGKGLVVLPLGG